MKTVAAPPRSRWHRQSPIFCQCGFTLTELAIVMVIVALLIGGMLMPLSAQDDLRRRRETVQSLAQASEALLGFAVANGRLPCPASAASTTGLEETTTGTGGGLTCSNTFFGVGVLPWATLGVPETDGWGNRFTYRVSVEFARGLNQTTFSVGCAPSPLPTMAAFALCSTGTLNVIKANGGGNVASSVPAVIVSHGHDGSGAFTPAGIQLNAGSDADELDNVLTNGGIAMGNTTFVADTETSTFDDIVVWLSPNILFNRMIAAGRLP